MSEPKGLKSSTESERANFPYAAFDFGKAVEFPMGLREIAEKSVAQTKDAYEKLRAAAEDATGALEGTFAIAAKATADYNRKVIEVARANANAVFDYARDLLDAKSLSDVAQLSTAHARRQFEALSEQTKDLAMLAEKVATAASEPIKTRLNATFGKGI